MARLIKRYENRKLYDTQASAYVSQSDIAEMVRRGETVEIVDNVTGSDLTAQTLTQIILEEGKNGGHLIPTELLHDLLRRGGKAIDVGLEQIKHGVDDLVQGSLGRLSRLLRSPKSDELEQIRDQLVHLETQLGRVLREAEQQQDPPDARS